jgi:uncharacterized membrane protein (DUF2068 family)
MNNPLRRPELLVCAWRGHVMPGASVEPLDGRHHVIARSTTDDRRVVQCLRCRTWSVIDPPPAGTGVAIESLDAVQRPRRGRALRDAIVLRVIAIDRAVHTAAFGAVAVAAFALRWKIDAVHGWANDVLQALSSARKGQGGASSHGLTAALLTRLAHVRPHSLLVLGMIASVYAVVSAFEAVGLWYEQRWAEYLTALATAGFLPLEIHELINRVTLVRIGAMVVNIAILVYLVVAKHLFGIGGPLPEESPEPLDPLPELAPVPSSEASP